MIRVYADADGRVLFTDGVVAKSPRLRRYVEQRRVEGERLHADFEERLHERNMALIGESVAFRERDVTHMVPRRERGSVVASVASLRRLTGWASVPE